MYEGKGVEPVVHNVRAAVKAGCKIIILTNACGGINTKFSVGQPVLIRDHISLTAVSPLSGATFLDLTDLYSKRIREIVKREDSTLDEGVYVHWRGPTYETPAEIHMMRTLMDRYREVRSCVNNLTENGSTRNCGTNNCRQVRDYS